jgi:nitroreductase/NAD-dependent dihydropyrimidine dehydrogenase PreA subunit
MNNSILILGDSCKKCGVCVEICPNKILTKSNVGISFREDRLDLCFRCGQCMAVCPTKSILINGLSYEKNFFDFKEVGSLENDFYSLIYSRRAIRNFKDMPVPKELLEKIVKAISFAPPGFPPNKVELIVISDPDIIRKSLPLMIEFYDFLVNIIKNPFARMKIGKEVGKQRLKTMQEHLIPLMESRLPELKNGTEDTITRDAQAMILFLADKGGEDIKADIHVAATYGMLAAHAIGLGGSIMDIIPPAIEKKKELRELFKVENNQEVVASLILGYPKYKYQRGIIRELKDVRRL